MQKFYEYPFIEFNEPAGEDIFINSNNFAFADLEPLVQKFDFIIRVSRNGVTIEKNIYAMARLIADEITESFQEEYEGVKFYMEKHETDLEDLLADIRIDIESNSYIVINEVINNIVSNYDVAHDSEKEAENE